MKLDELKKITSILKYPVSTAEQQEVNELLRVAGIDPGNFYQELEMSSRFVDTHQDVSYSNANLNLHSHTFCELLYCRSSCGAEYLVGPDRYRLQKGDIVFVPPGVSHRPILPERMTEPYRRDVLWISTEAMRFIANAFPDPTMEQRDHRVPIRTAGTRWEFIGDLFRMGVIEAEEKKPGWEAAVLGNTLMIFAHLKRVYIERSAGELKAEQPELLDRVTAYIEANFNSRITLKELARQFYVSDSTISHLFKQKMGVSVYRYVTQRRLIAAKTLIREGMLLEEVSRSVGFSDYSAFYRAFRQEFGISPKQFEKL